MDGQSEREGERERERDRKKDVWLLIKEIQISFKKRQALRENGEIFFPSGVLDFCADHLPLVPSALHWALSARLGGNECF